MLPQCCLARIVQEIEEICCVGHAVETKITKNNKSNETRKEKRIVDNILKA